MCNSYIDPFIAYVLFVGVCSPPKSRYSVDSIFIAEDHEDAILLNIRGAGLTKATAACREQVAVYADCLTNNTQLYYTNYIIQMQIIYIIQIKLYKKGVVNKSCKLAIQV